MCVFVFAADTAVPHHLLLLYDIPGGGAPLQRHAQLPDWHRHRPVRRARLLPGHLPARVQEAAHHYKTTA